MTLNSEPEIFYGDCMEFKAMIRSFPKHTKVIWMKGNEEIDINQPNYTGSSDVGDCPVLRINNVKTEDQDEYSIEVCNELGNERCKRELKVIGGKPKTNFLTVKFTLHFIFLVNGLNIIPIVQRERVINEDRD